MARRHHARVRRLRAAFWVILLCLAPLVPARAQNCGSIVLPTGIGETSSADITSFNPLFVDTAYNQEAAWLLYPALIWVNRFARIDWLRSLASSVTTTDDTVFTVTLRPWHWSDGAAVSSADVAYTFSLIQRYGTDWPGYGQGGLPGIVQAVRVLGPTQVQFVLRHAVNPTWFIYNALGNIQPLPQHVWGKYTLDQMFQLQSTPSFFSVVDGPLKIQSLAIGLDAVFVPNPAYDGPKMHFSRLVFKFLEGDGAAIEGVEAGDTDAAMLPPTLWASVRDYPGLHVEVLRQSDFANVLLLNFRNPQVAFFGDVRVRQAMEAAIDQETMIALLFHGAGNPAYGPVPADLSAFLPPATQPAGYDPAGARKLLREAGYQPGADGIMQKNGRRLSFVYLEAAGSDAMGEMDEFLQADLRAVGIEMKIRTMDFNQMLALMSAAPTGWQAAGVGMPALPYPSGEGQFFSGAGQNFGGYSDATMDKLIDASVNKPGLDGLFAYENYVSAQLPVIFFAGAKPVVVVNDRLHGMAQFVDPAGQFAPDQLTCSAGAP